MLKGSLCGSLYFWGVSDIFAQLLLAELATRTIVGYPYPVVSASVNAMYFCDFSRWELF
ncbi:hypothetical protein ACWA06_19355 [Serratia rhizosphaerae]|uniref:hypothetical protein n=1 Tax=Serratia TaxID=613 RepID=UPI001319E2C4|nr:MULTISPECIES: hypothetical protein [Serratia]MBU3894436.1 hypothetical protein [Serratia rubidaea]MEB6338169.1 hypothetical protein [Serratia rhizosphaerae]QPT13697.1 hypothetical protein I6G37_01305 [Serratia rubidaea]CAE1149722.1 protein of unknown function [Serratia sp. Tan611]